MPTEETAHQLDIHGRLDHGDKRMGSIEDRIVGLEAEVTRNTAVTQEVKEILDAAKLGLKVIGGVGALIKWGAPVVGGVAALWAYFHGGPKP